jgi:hypothetical protein
MKPINTVTTHPHHITSKHPTTTHTSDEGQHVDVSGTHERPHSLSTGPREEVHGS